VERIFVMPPDGGPGNQPKESGDPGQLNAAHHHWSLEIGHWSFDPENSRGI
jgi:hypothetical protein